jgi:hypothetical protein
MTAARVALIGACVVAIVPLAISIYFEHFSNPRVVRELIEQPNGERAGRVMLLTLPSGREIPVNYLREGSSVYAAADGRWWRELEGEGAPVRVLVRGERLSGRGRAVLDDPAHVESVFDRLRPDAIEGFGPLIEIGLGGGGVEGP